MLGVKPGVSIRELKAAHRDLAKVWHPDRFLHDPRLQEKAQEKLKEINDAYEQISSGKIPRSINPRPKPEQRAVSHEAATRPSVNWQWATVPLLVFVAVFAITTRTLLQQRSQHLAQEDAQVEETSNLDQDQSPGADSSTRAAVRNDSERPNPANAAPEPTTPDSLTTQPTPALATVTVTIDPETGLLAKPECRLRSRMTYPSGSQPSGYCNLSHAPPPKDSGIKSFATKLLPQRRKDAKRIQDAQ